MTDYRSKPTYRVITLTRLGAKPICKICNLLTRKGAEMSLATSPLLDSNQHRKYYLYKNYALVQFTLTTADINH